MNDNLRDELIKEYINKSTNNKDYSAHTDHHNTHSDSNW